MAPNLPFQGSLAGHQYASVTTAGKTWQADRAFLVREIRFTRPSATITNETVIITAESQTLFGGAVPIRMLDAALADHNVVPGNDNVIVWKPVRPFLWSPGFPLTFLPSATTGIMILAEEIPA